MSVKTRRQEYVEATRTALLESATRLFRDQGFTKTSLDEVAAAARVTKGAFYHHFASKQILFEQVLEQVNDRIADQVMTAGAAGEGPVERLTAGLNAFLDACLDPDYQRICLQQGPAVLGWERCRELEARMMSLLDVLLAELGGERMRVAPSPLLTRLLFRMVSEAAMAIGEADDKQATREQVGGVITAILHSLVVGTRHGRPAAPGVD